MIIDNLFESPQQCPECGGLAFSDLLLAEKKDACYSKVRSRYKVWPSAYASGALVQCRKKGAANWGNKSKNESMVQGANNIGAQIKAAYQKIYNAGDDAVEFAYYDSPIFAQYWDEYEGDLDSIIAEVNPSELQIILDELTSAAEDQGVAEAVTLDRSKNPNYPNDPATVKHRLDTAKAILSNPNSDSDSRRAAAAIIAKLEKGVAEGSGDGYYYLQGGIERSKKFASEAEAMAHSKRFFQLARVRRVTLKYKEPGQPAVVVKEFSFKDTPPPKSQMSWGDFYLQGKKQGIAEGKPNQLPTKGADYSQYDTDHLRTLLKPGILHRNEARFKALIRKELQKREQQSVAEAINPDITNPAFSHQQQIGDYLYVARYWSKGLKISAYDGNKLIGRADLMYHSGWDEPSENPKYGNPKKFWLESEITEVNPKYQRQGIMSNMYAYAKMLGNSVKPSEFRSDDAQAAWKSWRQAGDAKHLTSNEGVAEGDNEKIAGRYDPDEFDAMVSRLKKLAGAGPMKTVYDPQKRVYRNVPVAQQPSKK